MKPPITWYGSKQRQAQHIIPLLPEHRMYAEVFGGSAAVLFANSPAEREFYNDLDGDIVNFFRVLRERGHELRDSLLLTPYARAELAEARRRIARCDDPLERARCFFVISMQSINGKRDGGWSRCLVRNRTPAFYSAIERIANATRRLRNVQIENQDFRKLIPALDGPDVLFYLDPPYLPDTRVSKNDYAHEMTRNDHDDLLNLVKHLKGMVVLSGYDHAIYEQGLKGWDRHEFTVSSRATVKGVAGKTSPRTHRTEVIWRNPQAIANVPSHLRQPSKGQGSHTDTQRSFK